MQSITWYKKRLLTMSPTEILWRLLSAVRDFIDRYRYDFQLYPSPSDVSQGVNCGNGYGFEVRGISDASGRQAMPDRWKQALVQQAEKIAVHRLCFFNLDDVFLGAPIDWNRDHAHGKQSPLEYSQSIDYRDFRVTGDCKLVWEPNRHLHLTVLGRAYNATGDRRFASDAVDQIQSWIDQCPFGKGMNWRSPLELGIRLINWVWTMDLIRESGLVAGAFRSRLIHSAYLHLWEITRRYSKGSSANNHLVGEAAGVFVASSYFKDLPNAQKWAEESQKMLEREIFAQTYEDGCSREQAMGYHLFVLQFFLIAGLTGRWSGREFSPGYWRRIESMLEFAAALSEGSGRLPSIGDADDGYVLDLGQGPPGIKDLLCVGAVLFDRADFKEYADGFREPAFWLIGSEAKQRFKGIPSTKKRRQLASRGFKESGYYLLQCGPADSTERISIVVDCAELGFKSIAAHGHADALSFALCAFGKEVFVDPGTYDYFTYPEWRTYFRSTRAHNTVVVDDQDQSVMLGPFMWGRRANSRIIEWSPGPQGGGSLMAEHDGYGRLKDPVIHRRSIALDPQTRLVTITDEIFAAADHGIAICFHLAENCRASVVSPDTICIALPEGKINLTVDPRLKLTLLLGSESPKGGWVSRGYHHRVPAPTIVAEGECRGNDSFRSTIVVGMPDELSAKPNQAGQS